MLRLTSRVLPALAVAGVLGLAAPHASADEFKTIATFTAVGEAPNYAWSQVPHERDGEITSLATAGVTNFTINFSAAPLNDNPGQTIQNLSAFGDIPAELVVTGGGALPTSFGHLAGPPSVPATFSFVYTGAAPIFVNGANHFAGETLLSFSTSFAFLGGGWPVPDFTHPTSFGQSGIRSDFGSFGHIGETAFGEFSQRLFSPVAIHDQSYWPWVDSYEAQLTSGSFTGHVPEPSAWALQIAGFVVLGLVLRKRRANLSASAA